MLLGRKPSCASSTARRPLRSASTDLRTSTAGVAAPPGSVIPSASLIEAIVEAVPMSMQWPCVRLVEASASRYSSGVSSPRRAASANFQYPLPDPTRLPRKYPGCAGPPVTTMQGTSALAAPINDAGPLLSQPASRTTASSGFDRIVSSTSIEARLRYIIAAGF